MQKYQIIPRKFRPSRFSQVAGHEAIVTTLKNALAQNRLGQAYLFCGARGCGKTTLARLLAKALNCAKLDENQEPCNSCTSCQEIAEGCNLDVIEIDGASNRGIDDIRQINETVGYAPNNSPYKIYIIDEVHMLTKEAFNALLKTLEEPPKHVKFFFATTEPHKVPPTIISRCQRFNLTRIPEQHLVEKLKRICTELTIDAHEDALTQIARLSEGSLRDAESLLDQLICFGKTPITLDLTREVFGLIESGHLTALDEAIQTENIDAALSLAQKLYESGKDIGATVDSLLEHYRTHLLIARTYTKDQCLTILDILMQWQQHMLKTPFKHIHLEMLFLNLVRSAKRLPLDNLVHRLLELEKGTPSTLPPEPPAPAPAPKIVEEIKPAPPKPELPKDDTHPSRYDTLIRFAAVELDGTVTRD